MLYNGLAVTGTDTGAGKTAVACGLAMLYREAGLRVGVLKPVETGCIGEELAPQDGLALARAAGVEDVEISRVAPWRFKDPVSPEEAARRAGTGISVDAIFQAMDWWTGRSDLVIVETAGGLLVPINKGFSFADLLKGLDLPVVVAAANRLGVINHALLTLEALRSRGLTVLAMVLSTMDPAPDSSAKSNAADISWHGQVPVYEVPYAPSDPASAAAGALRGLGLPGRPGA